MSESNFVFTDIAKTESFSSGLSCVCAGDFPAVHTNTKSKWPAARARYIDAFCQVTTQIGGKRIKHPSPYKLQDKQAARHATLRALLVAHTTETTSCRSRTDRPTPPQHELRIAAASDCESTRAHKVCERSHLQARSRSFTLFHLTTTTNTRTKRNVFMKTSSYGYYGSVAAASSIDDVVLDHYGAAVSTSSSGGGPALMSRGMQLEAAVEKLPGWYFDDDYDTNNNNNSDTWALHSSGSRTRRSPPLYFLDDSMDLLGSVAEFASSSVDDDDDDDSERNNQYSSTTAAPSIRSRYLLDSPVSPVVKVPVQDTAPASSSTATSTLDDSAVTAPLSVSTTPPASRATTMARSASQPSHLDTSPQSHHRHSGGGDVATPPMGRQHRLSSRRSTLSSSCACTDLVVTRYTMGGRDKKVMYHIDVVNHENQLQTYTIRRSYTDFKVLHNDLSAVLDARKEYYASRAQLRLSVLENKERRSLAAASGASGYTSGNSFAAAGRSTSPEDAVEAAVMAFNLPTLPHAGLMSFWRRHDHSHLKHRCEVFQGILRAILKMPFLRESFAMQKFLSTAPCAIRERGSSYVSLCEYSVPTIDLDEEHRERRRRAQEHRRNSSVTSASMGMYEY